MRYLILIVLSVFIAVAVHLLGKIRNRSLSLFAVTLVVFVSVTGVNLVSSVVQSFECYSCFTARYLRYSAELHRLAEAGDLSKLRDAVVFFDARVQAAPQSSEALAAAAAAVVRGELPSGTGSGEQKGAEPTGSGNKKGSQ
jgi:hypothetical protein